MGVSRPNASGTASSDDASGRNGYSAPAIAPQSAIDQAGNRRNSRDALSEFESGRAPAPAQPTTVARENTPPSGLSGVSRPGPAPSAVPPAQPRPSTTAGISRPVGPGPATAPASAIDTSVNRNMSRNALAQYEADRNRAARPATPVDTAAAQNNPAFSQAGRSYGNMDNYYAERNRSRQDWGTPPQIIVQQMHPNYGVWDVMFLTMLMSNINRPGYSEWAAAHRDDPDYRAWRRDADRLAEDNADMRRQLSEMDAKMKDAVPSSSAMQLPPGVSPAAAIAPEAMMNNPFMQQQASAPAPQKGSGMTWVIVIAVLLVLGIVGFFVLVRMGRRPNV